MNLDLKRTQEEQEQQQQQTTRLPILGRTLGRGPTTNNTVGCALGHSQASKSLTFECPRSEALRNTSQLRLCCQVSSR